MKCKLSNYKLKQSNIIKNYTNINYQNTYQQNNNCIITDELLS